MGKCSGSRNFITQNFFRPAPQFKYGIFNHIVPDNAPELTSQSFRRVAHKYGCRIKPIEAWTPNQNLAGREVKRLHRREMRRSNAPAVLWDHCLMLMAERCSHTAFAQDGSGPPIQQLTGDTPDISHIVEHKWYDWVKLIDEWYFSKVRFYHINTTLLASPI